jgi:hypothetical protein
MRAEKKAETKKRDENAQKKEGLMEPVDDGMYVLKDTWAIVETVGSALPHVGACCAVVGFIVAALGTKLANDDAALEMRRTCEILTDCIAMVMPVLRPIMSKMPEAIWGHRHCPSDGY